MQQLELLSIDNPCVNVCQSDKRGYCLGCFRSRDERFNWNKLTAPEKRRVLELCKQRGQRRKAKAKKEQLQQQIPIVAVESPNKEAPKEPESVKDMGLDMFDL